MLEFKNADGHTVSLNPMNLVQLMYIDRHTSASGTSIYCNKFQDEATETAESLATRAMTQAKIVSFHLFVDGKVSIPTWFNAEAVVAVRETKTGHSVIIAETGTSTLVAETYEQVLAALAAAKVMGSPTRTGTNKVAKRRSSAKLRAA
ncbi:hypothetical protein GOE05_28725 [Sinorhizobium medicae]|nr:hypothetical protein [Sinorhizobium medicae]